MPAGPDAAPRPGAATPPPDARPTAPPWRSPGFSGDTAGAVTPEQSAEAGRAAPEPSPPRGLLGAPGWAGSSAYGDPAAAPPPADDRTTRPRPPQQPSDDAGRAAPAAGPVPAAAEARETSTGTTAGEAHPDTPDGDAGTSRGRSTKLVDAAGAGGVTGGMIAAVNWMTTRRRRREERASSRTAAAAPPGEVQAPTRPRDADTLSEDTAVPATDAAAADDRTEETRLGAGPSGPTVDHRDRDAPADPTPSEPQQEPEHQPEQQPEPTSRGGSGAAGAALGGAALAAGAYAASRSRTPDDEPVDHEPVDHEPVDHEPVDHEPVDRAPVDHTPADSSTATTPENVSAGHPAGDTAATPPAPSTAPSSADPLSDAAAATTVENPASPEPSPGPAPEPEPSSGPTVPSAPAADPQQVEAQSAWSARAERSRRRRRVLLVLLVAVVAVLLVWAIPWLVATVSSWFSGGEERTSILPPDGAAPAASAPAPRPELPRGGTTFFPGYRVVAYYGTPDNPNMGILGDGPPEAMAQKLEEAAQAFATPGRVVQPTMELIVHVADGAPGEDGDYSHAIDEAKAWQYLAVARANRQLLVIDIQPGSSDFLSTTKPWERILREPDVGLALDPEWRMPPGQVPGQQIGTVSSAEVNETAEWLAGIVREGNLPQKLFVVHQFTPNMITEPERLVTPPELAVVQHVDGFGGPADKIAKYSQLARPGQLHPGFKLFYTQDTPVLSPAQTLGLDPAPDFVTYQ